MYNNRNENYRIGFAVKSIEHCKKYKINLDLCLKHEVYKCRGNNVI